MMGPFNFWGFTMNVRRASCFVVLCMLLSLMHVGPAVAAHGTTVRVSLVDGTTTQATGGLSSEPSVSAGGEWVAFTSAATDVVTGDSNGDTDVFARNTITNVTVRVSVSASEAQLSANSDSPVISSNGRYVVFRTDADIAAPDANGFSDIYLRDRDTDADNIFDEAATATTTLISVDPGAAQANGASRAPALTLDGTTPVVAFESDASDLVAADTNGAKDIFARKSSTTTRVSLATDGTEGDGDSSDPSIADQGRFVAFTTAATNLLLDDANGGVTDVVVRDRDTDDDSILDEPTDVSLTAASLDSFGGQVNAISDSASISDDGQVVAFRSDASTLVPNDTNVWGDVFLRDTVAGTTTRVSVDSAEAQANGKSDQPFLAGDWIAFRSWATNLVSGDTNGVRDIFVRDLTDGTTERVSTTGALGDTQANNKNYDPVISSDGQRVAFASDATNLVLSDTNAKRDIFVRTRDETAPTPPTGFTHPGHTLSTWTSDTTVDIAWSASDSGGSGLDGFSFLWDTSPSTTPDETKDTTALSTTSPALSEGQHYFHIRAVDNDGHWSAAAHRGPFFIDATPPTAVLGTLAPTHLAAFTVTWSATDAGSGVKNHDVRYRSAAWNGSLGSYTTWKSATTATSALLSPSTSSFDAGRMYCFSVRARDMQDQLGAWSAEDCAALPRDDGTLGGSSGWTSGTSSSYYRSTWRRTSTKGAYLAESDDTSRSFVTLVTRKCSSCGSIRISVQYAGRYHTCPGGFASCSTSGTWHTDYNLASATNQYKVLLTAGGHPLVSVSSIQNVSISVISDTGKYVYIDGLAFNK